MNRLCPLCSSPKVLGSHAISRDLWKVVECASCGFVFLQNPPKYEELVDELAWEKVSDSDSKRRAAAAPASRKASRFIRKIRAKYIERVVPRLNVSTLLRQFAQPGNILDVGCGAGGALLNLDEHFVPWGVEISRDLAQEAKAAFSVRGGDVIHASALEGLSRLDNEKFSAIIMRSYLEHEVNPHEVLVEASRLLHPTGIIVIKVPNFGSLNALVMRSRWCGVRLPGHVNYFRPSDLRKLVEQSGLSVFRFGKFRYRPAVSDNMWMIASKTVEH